MFEGMLYVKFSNELCILLRAETTYAYVIIWINLTNINLSTPRHAGNWLSWVYSEPILRPAAHCSQGGRPYYWPVNLQLARRAILEFTKGPFRREIVSVFHYQYFHYMVETFIVAIW